MFRNKGFTLLELIIVIIVIGILASIALPRYIEVAERGRASEGKSLLGILRSAQLRYQIEHGNYTNALGDLDATYTVPKYFSIALTGTAANLASVTRNALDVNPTFAGYVLQISDDGNITCAGGTCPK